MCLIQYDWLIPMMYSFLILIIRYSCCMSFLYNNSTSHLNMIFVLVFFFINHIFQSFCEGRHFINMCISLKFFDVLYPSLNCFELFYQSLVLNCTLFRSQNRFNCIEFVPFEINGWSGSLLKKYRRKFVSWTKFLNTIFSAKEVYLIHL